jgi:tetratricopeptide (TPR) repeat protein
MKVASKTLVAMAVSLAAACTRTTLHPQSTQTEALDRSCRAVAAAPADGDDDIARLQQDLRQRRDGPRAAEHLGYRFVARARLSNTSVDYAVAEQAAACLESITPNEPAAWLLRGHVLHQLHRFSEAETIARRLVATREFVLDFGLLGDVLLEQGRVAEAAEAYQKMIDLKPFYQSYTRAAHMRWLKGDLPGAIEMMRAAVQAASPRDKESTAWAYSRLAMYELQRGHLTDAARMADASLQFVPDYAAALLVRGRIELAQGKAPDAVRSLERAARLNPLPEYQWTLADALRTQRRVDEAVAIEQQLTNEGALEDPRTLALYLSTRHHSTRHLSTRDEDSDKAISLARRELVNRQDVFTLDALAWALAAAGHTEEASALMIRALAEGTEDARLFLHAAVIAAADSRTADAARYARKAHALRFTLLPSELGVLRRGIGGQPRT